MWNRSWDSARKIQLFFVRVFISRVVCSQTIIKPSPPHTSLSAFILQKHLKINTDLPSFINLLGANVPFLSLISIISLLTRGRGCCLATVQCGHLNKKTHTPSMYVFDLEAFPVPLRFFYLGNLALLSVFYSTRVTIEHSCKVRHCNERQGTSGGTTQAFSLCSPLCPRCFSAA